MVDRTILKIKVSTNFFRQNSRVSPHGHLWFQGHFSPKPQHTGISYWLELPTTPYYKKAWFRQSGLAVMYIMTLKPEVKS